VSLERVSKGVKDVGDKSKTVSGEVKSFGSQIAGSFNLTAMAAGAVVAGLMGAVKSAIEADKAAYRLSTAVGHSSAALIEFAEARQRATVYEDDATIAAMSRIAMVTKDEAAIKSLTIASQNLASRTGKDLLTATEAVAKAAAGSGMALRKMGITMDTSGMSATELSTKLDELTNNAAELEAQTAGGKATQAINAWGNAWEDVGTSLLGLIPVIEAVAFVVSESVGIVTGFMHGLDAIGDLMVGDWKSAWQGFAQVEDDVLNPVRNLTGANTEAANAFTSVADSAVDATSWVRQYDDAAKAAGISAEDLASAVEGYIEQAEKQAVTEEAIKRIQEERPDVALALNLETTAQKEHNRAQEEAKRRAERAAEAARMQAAAIAELRAQRMLDAMQAARDAALEGAPLPEGFDANTQPNIPVEEYDNGTEAMRKFNEEQQKSGAVAAQNVGVFQLQQSTLAQGTNSMVSSFARLGAMNKKTAMAAKRIAQAQAIVNTYAAANEALKNPPGPPFTIPFMLAAVATGIANVAMIEKTGYASGGYVRGHGGGRSDMVDARLSAGEGVLTAATVARIGGEAAIDRLNAGGGTGGGLTINFTGPVTDRAFVRDYIVPEVRKAVGRGMA
jgi:hypothetical protein